MTNSVTLCTRPNEVECSSCGGSMLWWIQAFSNDPEPLRVIGLRPNGPFLHPVFSDYAFDGSGVILAVGTFSPEKAEIHILNGEVAICPGCNGAIVFESEDARVESREVEK